MLSTLQMFRPFLVAYLARIRQSQTPLLSPTGFRSLLRRGLGLKPSDAAVNTYAAILRRHAGFLS
ncbi:hypothetical protein BFL43_08390 [Williamsia sp. 1135]|nr:hypothetical protein BFL43_08390 [Williamsia sp. 1135]